jgi:hypothetical protein
VSNSKRVIRQVKNIPEPLVYLSGSGNKIVCRISFSVFCDSAVPAAGDLPVIGFCSGENATFLKIRRIRRKKEMATGKVELFNCLSFDEKSKLVWLKATLLLSKTEGNTRTNIYYMDGFYIQLFYNVQRTFIENIEATESKDVIDGYLDQVELSSLF